MALNRKKLRTRAISAVVGALVLGLAALILPKMVFHIIVLAAGVIALVECRVMTRGFQYEFFLIPGLLVLVLGLVSSQVDVIPLMWLPYAAMLSTTLIALASNLPMPKIFPSMGATLTGAAYISLALVPLSILIEYGGEDVRIGRYFISLYAVIIWSNDIAAYLVGSMIGRRKIAPQMSPNKTVAGTLGGLLTSSTLAALGSIWLLPNRFPLGHAILLGLTCGILGFLGDLIESSWKRGSNIKDSGNIIPGHGGILDRLDSLFLTAPAYVAYVLYFLPPAS